MAAALHWAALHGFLAARAVPGLETAGPGFYARSVALEDDETPGGARGRALGTMTVRPAPEGGEIVATLRLGAGTVAPERRARADAAARLRRLFDLAADPGAIAAGLSADPRLARLVAARPGLRLPGAWDGFELAVRGILGQQVSVAAAVRLAGRLVAAFGPPLTSGEGRGDRLPGLSHAFPEPEAPVEADVARVLDMPRARGGAIRALAAAVIAEPDLLAPGQAPEAAAARLTALPGIGPWTAQYIAMRALRDPDALPVGDIGLLRALDDGAGRPTQKALLARADAWRPWRAYAAMHLWAHDAERQAAGARA